MSTMTRVQRNFQITIPKRVREKANIKIGDVVDFEVLPEGILIKPQVTIDKSQTWFWSKEWQEEEKKVERDFAKGNVLISKNLKDFFKELDEE